MIFGAVLVAEPMTGPWLSSVRLSVEGLFAEHLGRQNARLPTFRQKTRRQRGALREIFRRAAVFCRIWISP